jgi:hypothetical protein
MIVKQLKNCKLIISGDFNQLDVIHDLQKYNYTDASILKELCDINIIQLSKCRRSDDTLFNLIAQILKNLTLIKKIQKLIFVGPMKQENLLIISICK